VRRYLHLWGARADMAASKSLAQPRKLNFIQTLSAVLWSFFGVRNSKDHERDMSQLNPVYVVLTGLLAGALFVLSLALMVGWILR